MPPDLWFDETYRAHASYVWHTLRRLGVAERDRGDLVQEVFVVVHRQRASYDAARPIRPWLFGIAFRVASNHRNKASNARELLQDGDAPAVVDAGPAADEVLYGNERRRLVADALAALDDDKRAAFILCDIEGLSAAAAGDVLGENPNTLASRLKAAREIVIRRVHEICGAPTNTSRKAS